MSINYEILNQLIHLVLGLCIRYEKNCIHDRPKQQPFSEVQIIDTMDLLCCLGDFTSMILIIDYRKERDGYIWSGGNVDRLPVAIVPQELIKKHK